MESHFRVALRFAHGQLVALDESLRKASVNFVNDTRQLAAGDDHFACVGHVTCRQFWGCVVSLLPLSQQAGTTSLGRLNPLLWTDSALLVGPPGPIFSPWHLVDMHLKAL